MSENNFQKTTLPGGLRVLTEVHPHVQSATLGLWIQAGSIYEKRREQGLSHVLEHMVFKGTKTRSMSQIAAQMDVLGGGMNAFTEREFVCFHVKVLSDDIKPALELLCDFAANPDLDEELLEVEKGVILEEIRAVEDAPEERVEDLFLGALWEKSRWGRPILGVPESVEKLTSQDLRRFINQFYGPQRAVLVAVGQVNHQEIVQMAQKWLADLPGDKKNKIAPPSLPEVSPHSIVVRDETEGAHIIIGTRAYAYDDPKRFAVWALDAIMTGGYSSRLFQEVREKRGLCYSIGGLSTSYRGGGYWAVETSVAPQNAAKTADLIGKEIRKVKTRGVKAVELKRAKQMARVNLLLSEESSSAQMGRIARNELYFGRQKSTVETLKQIEAVTLDEIQGVAREMFVPELMNFAALGPIPQKMKLGIDVG
ncbi:putative Zn-dependent peptidase [Abditibacterium utsteinense]|uniref:Putative Zn-dependent peptidase n=1 Tax=Abditibacterium utsteinense TaxID=1960156 RepID=A0A2S8SSN3_9BACT|nr:pitrilysin family protein [Abditibacterium utsteinense]PQV63823.1 putative Zn-dependent peptidase [Abditibacterium utsteinense]